MSNARYEKGREEDCGKACQEGNEKSDEGSRAAQAQCVTQASLGRGPNDVGSCRPVSVGREHTEAARPESVEVGVGPAPRRRAVKAKSATGVDKVLAAQEVRDLETRIATMDSATGGDIKGLESAFVKIAKRFGENRGIGYGAWRDAGVPAVVLKKAGVARTRG